MSFIREFHRKFHERSKARWDLYGFRNLLVWLCMYLFVGPFLSGFVYAEVVVAVLLTVALVASIEAISGSWKLMVTAISVLVVVLILLALKTMGVSFGRLDIGSLGFAVFMSVLAYSFSGTLFRIKRVTGNVLCAALCLYLVIGMLFGALYAVVETAVPGSYAGVLLDGSSSPHELAHHFHYFSLVTLSTLGYGDITPQTRGAGVLCQAEAVIGQFLTVVLVARLVGIQVAQETSKDPS